MADIVEVARFDNVFEAHRVVAVLDAAGVEAEVADANTGAALPHILAIGVRVVVAREDLDRARAALEEDARERRARRDAPDDDDDGGPGDDGPVEGAATEGEAAPAPVGQAPAVAAARRPLTEADAVAWASRTRTLALVGLGVWILALGALWRAASAPAEVEASPRARALLRQARVVGWVTVGAAAALFWLYVCRSGR